MSRLTARWKYRFYQTAWAGLDLLYPPRCGGCDKKGERWCSECQRQTQTLQGTLCRICGLPIEKAGTCVTCAKHPPTFQALRAWTAFEGPIRKALHQIKYHRDPSLADDLAQNMLPFWHTLQWQVDVAVPLPLGNKRRESRGYNQAEFLTLPLAVRLNWDYQPQALTRSRETRTQVGLSAFERRTNVAGAFLAQPALVSGKSALLVDDVSTTGATLASAAQALLQAGATQVYAFTVARALPHHGLKIA
jgi:competence protein ComFC